MKDFIPTFLYIKRHPVTGLLYLGKTSGSEQYLLKEYLGSGNYWEDHLRIHGEENIETPWYCLYTEKEELVRFALMLSEQMNIVKVKDENGKKIWANLRPENGLDGGVKGVKCGPQSESHKINNAAARKGNKYGPQKLPRKAEHSANISSSNLGKSRNKGVKQSLDHASKTAAKKGNTYGKANKGQIPWNKGIKIQYKPQSAEVIENRTGKKRGKYKELICPQCAKVGHGGAMKQHHFDNCKKKTL